MINGNITLLRSDTYYLFFFEHVILTINDSLVIIFIIEVHVIPAILIIIEVLTLWNLKLYTMIFSFHDVWASKLNLPWFSHQRNRTPPHGHDAEMTWFRPRIYEIHPPIPENSAGFSPMFSPCLERLRSPIPWAGQVVWPNIELAGAPRDSTNSSGVQTIRMVYTMIMVNDNGKQW